MSNLTPTKDAVEFWKNIPGPARVVVNLPVPSEWDMFTGAQQWAINALTNLVGPGPYYGRKFDISVAVPARGLPRMPIGVYAIEMMKFDPFDGAATPSGFVSYLHPDGSLRTFYGGVL